MTSLKTKTLDFYSDPEIYDTIAPFSDDIPFWVKWCKAHQSKTVLELCCGTGRLAIPLTAAGMHYTGIDLSSSFVKAARAKAVLLGKKSSFHKGDMRRFSLNRTFGTVALAYNSVAHLYTHNDIRQCFRCVHDHLAAGGRFIIQFFIPKFLDNQSKRRELGSYKLPDGRFFRHYEENRYDPLTQINHIKWQYIFEDGTITDTELVLRMLFPEELSSHLKYNGFRIEKQFGCYDETPVSGNSALCITVCRRV